MQPITAIYTHREGQNVVYVLDVQSIRMDEDGFVETFAHVIFLNEDIDENYPQQYGDIKTVSAKDLSVPLTMTQYRELKNWKERGK